MYVWLILTLHALEIKEIVMKHEYLEDLKTKISNGDALMKQLIRKTLRLALLMGERLIDAQDYCSQNNIKWGKWVADELPFSRQMAHNYRKIAMAKPIVEQWIETEEVKSISEALKRLRKSKDAKKIIKDNETEFSLDEKKFDVKPFNKALSVSPDVTHDDFTVFDTTSESKLPPLNKEVDISESCDIEVDNIKQIINDSDLVRADIPKPLAWSRIVDSLADATDEDINLMVISIKDAVLPLSATAREHKMNSVLNNVSKLKLALSQLHINDYSLS